MSNLAEKKTDDDVLPEAASSQKKSRHGITVIVTLLLLVVAGVLIYRKSFGDYERPVVDKLTTRERDEVAEKLDRHLKNSDAGESTGSHPLDPALEIARQTLKHIQTNIADYTCVLTKQERLGDELGDEQQIFCKVRSRKESDGKITVPLSVYMRFIKPSRGREVIWVEGRNEGKLSAHEPGLANFRTWHLPPEGKIAMLGQRYPISQTGFENLVFQLIERGLRELRHDKSETDVEINKEVEFNGRKCVKIVVRHPIKSDRYEFYEGRIFVDSQWNIPVHYSAYLWPEDGSGELPLIESYTYSEIKLNVGLTDKDFDYTNPEYDFP